VNAERVTVCKKAGLLFV